MTAVALDNPYVSRVAETETAVRETSLRLNPEVDCEERSEQCDSEDYPIQQPGSVLCIAG